MEVGTPIKSLQNVKRDPGAIQPTVARAATAGFGYGAGEGRPVEGIATKEVTPVL